MTKQRIILNEKKVNSKMCEMHSEFESKGYIENGFLCYEESDKKEIFTIFSTYGFSFWKKTWFYYVTQ